jgi:hypothetical protein
MTRMMYRIISPAISRPPCSPGLPEWPKLGSDPLETPMKRALITGITGQDGSYLAELLLAKG